MLEKTSIATRILLSGISCSIAFTPIYGAGFNADDFDFRRPLPAVSGIALAIGDGHIKPKPIVLKDPNGLLPRQVPGNESNKIFDNLKGFNRSCSSRLPTRFDPGFLKPIEKDDSLVAPIIHDINACNEDRAKQCLTMLSRSVSNYQQALIGFDENRDNLAEAGSSLQYREEDIQNLLSALANWNAIKDRISGPERELGVERQESADEKLLKTALDPLSPNAEPNSAASRFAAIAKIHMALSEELVIAAEATYSGLPSSDYAPAKALLASINPSAHVAFNCLTSFDKGNRVRDFGDRKIIGYFTGKLYGEVKDDSRGVGPLAAILIPSLIGGGAVLAAKLIEVWHEHLKYEDQKKHDTEEKDKDRAFNFEQKAKDRDLQRELAGHPPKETTVVATPKEAPASNKPKPNTIDNPAPKEKDDPFGPFVSDDYEAKDNKHFAVDMECPSDFSGLDINNPTIHPELVTDFDQEHYLERNLLGEGFERVVARQTIYHYQNPIYSAEADKKLVTLDKFTEHTRNKACEVLDSANPADSPLSKSEYLEYANRMHELEMELSRMRNGMIK